MVATDAELILLITSGVIARELGEPLHRVVRILNTRDHIRPLARAGTLRLYERDVIAEVRHELHAIDARRTGGGTSDG